MRDLRGQSAQDVIYSGNRRTLGMAEVRMAFERSRHDGRETTDELVVSRRLFRSGDSEYLLDGRRVRLRDVADALRAIGIDDGEHVVVNQGMADALLTASPLDRRGLLEQAAGLAGYRTRRDEARGKLAITRRNVETIESLLGEMEPRLRMLRRQARAVADREEARGRLRTALILWLSWRWRSVTDDIDVLEAERVVVAELRLAAIAEVQRLDTHSEAMLNAERSWQQEMDVVIAALHLAERERDAAEHRLAAATERLGVTRRERAQCIAAMDDLVFAEREAARAGVQPEDDGESGTPSEYELKSSLRALEIELAAAQAWVQGANKAHEDLLGEVRSLRDRQANAARAEASARAQWTEVDSRLRRLNARMSEDQARRDAIGSDLMAAKQRVSLAREELHRLEDESAANEARADNAETHRDRVERIRTRMRRRLNDMARLLDAAVHERDRLARNVEGSLLKTISVSGGWEKAVASALRRWSGDDLSCELDAYLSWRGQLESSVDTRILWADLVVSGLDRISPLHGAAIVRTRAEAEALWSELAHRPAYLIGAPPVSVLSRDGFLLGSLGLQPPERDDDGTRYLLMRRSAADLHDKIETLSRRLTRIDAHFQKLEVEELEHAAARSSTAKAVFDARRRLSLLSADVERLTHLKTGFERDLGERSAAIERLAAELPVLTQRVQTLKRELEAAGETLTSVEGGVETSQSKLADAQSNLAGLQDRVGRLARELDAITARRVVTEQMRWDPLESTCRHASLSIL